VILGSEFHGTHDYILLSDGSGSVQIFFKNYYFGWPVKLLLAFASTIIPGFSLLEIHDQDFYSLPDI
jgi:hypothetical protein